MAKKKSSKKKKASTPAAPVAPATYVPQTYTSAYQPQIDEVMNKVTNWNYDPMQDANYQALAKVYGARGNTAAKNSMADAAALNGGYGTSYAVSAAQQARNQYNQELASMIPDLEANAYNRAQTTLAAYRDADDTAYGRFRDSESDRQWNWTNSYNAYRDAMSDYQWQLQYNQSKKSSAGGGGGGRRSSGGGGGYSSGGSGGFNIDAAIDKARSALSSGKSSSKGNFATGILKGAGNKVIKNTKKKASSAKR